MLSQVCKTVHEFPPSVVITTLTKSSLPKLEDAVPSALVKAISKLNAWFEVFVKSISGEIIHSWFKFVWWILIFAAPLFPTLAKPPETQELLVKCTGPFVGDPPPASSQQIGTQTKNGS